MELCTGGSLFNLLDDPENSYGLDEDEFLLVLSHLSAGMNHLRDNRRRSSNQSAMEASLMVFPPKMVFRMASTSLFHQPSR